MKCSRMVAIGLLLVITCVTRESRAAEGDNLVTNGTFDTDASGWTAAYNSPAVWSQDDADASPISGSVVVSSALGGSQSPVKSECIPVSGGSDYVFRVAHKWVERSPSFAWGGVRVDWYDACGGQKLGYERFAVVSDSWVTSEQFASAPLTATSARVSITVSRDYDFPRSGGVAAFDNIVLAPLVCGDGCGDPVKDAAEHSAATPGLVTSSDALYILKGAVGYETCPLCICDVNASGDVTAIDSLLTLAAVAGAPVSLTCPE